jgi:hypothetical protein
MLTAGLIDRAIDRSHSGATVPDSHRTSSSSANLALERHEDVAAMSIL